MEKLEMKHLAPYLPYGLSMEVDYGHKKEIHLFQLELDRDFNIRLELSNAKPILRPMSDMYKMICQDKDYYHPNEELRLDYSPNDYGIKFNGKDFCYDIESCVTRNGKTTPDDIDYFQCENQYEIWNTMFEWKFDMFGLIEKGLAIDINTLELNPYW